MLICDISILHKYGKQALDGQLQPLDLNWQEMVVLMALETIPNAGQALLSGMLQTDKGNVTRLLNSMEDRGLIMRRVREDDSRRKDIRLTEDGAARLPALHEAMGRWEAACYRGLSAGQMADFEKACAVIIGNIYQRNHEERKEQGENA